MRNMSHEERIQEYRRNLEQTLRRQPLQMPELCKQYLRDNVAKSLQSAVESTFQETMGVSFEDLFETLQKLDQDIYELQVLQKRPNARKSFYEDRARYFTMVMPDPELVKHLASESFRDEQLEDIRRYVSDFLQVEDSLSMSFDEFRAFFRRHRLATEPWSVESSERTPSPTASGTANHQRPRQGSDEPESPQTQGALPTRLRRVFSLDSFWARKFKIFLMSLSTSVARFAMVVAKVGFRKKRLSPNLEATTALNLLRVYVNRENETKRFLPVDEALVSEFTEYIQGSREESSLIKAIETFINKHLPNMNSSEFARRFCKKIVELFEFLLEVEKSRLTIRVRTSVFSLGRLTLFSAPPPWALFWPLLLGPVSVAQISGGVSWFSWLFIELLSVMSIVLLGTVSFFLARRQLRRAVEQELKELVSVLVERTIESTSSHVTPDWVSQAVKDIDVQFRSRPLQRILDGSLEEVHQLVDQGKGSNRLRQV